MNHPVLSNQKRRLIYLTIWAIIIMAHLFFLYFFFQQPLGYALLDSLIFNSLFMIMGIWIWYIVKYNDFEIKNLVNLIAGHVISAGILLGLWIMASRYLITLTGYEAASPRWTGSALAPRLVIGIFYYLLTILIYYLFIYYENAKEKIEKEARREARYREAELNALKSQINPHFIFNSLNSISSLTVSDPVRAQEMIVRMSDFFRITLKNDHSQLTVLENELAFTALYFEMEKIRFGDKLSFYEDLQEGLKKVRIPHMILQPLVENAVKHGVQESMEPVQVILKGYIRDDYLVLSLKNRFDPDQRVVGEGIGLKNVRERLRLIYGEYDLLNTFIENDYFTAKIRIPLQNIDK